MILCNSLIFYNDKDGIHMDNMQFAQRIKDRCKEKGYTISDVLVNSKITRNFMYQLKIGQLPSIEIVERLANNLDCSIDYLIGRTEKPDINK